MNGRNELRPYWKNMSIEAGQKILIVGAGRSGLAAARYCLAQGAHPILNDIQDERSLGKQILPFKELKIPLRLGGHGPDFFNDADAVIVSPGVPSNLAAFAPLRSHGVPIWGELELASRLTNKPLIAVTGTNGKSTAATLIHAMLQKSQINAGLAGNIGTPFLEFLNEQPDCDAYVLEVSSYQLETIDRFHPCIAVFLNVSPDHRARHPDMATYATIKGRMMKNQTKEDWLIYNADDPFVVSQVNQAQSQKIPWSLLKAISPGIYYKDDSIIWFRDNKQEVYSLKKFPLAGAHNIENAMAAIAAARLAGASLAGTQGALDSFKGLAHRYETVAQINGVTFINDSKATNVGASVRAVDSIKSGPLLLLLGGEDKQTSYEPLRMALLKLKDKKIFAYGQAADAIYQALHRDFDIVKCTHLENAFDESVSVAHSGSTVLLAPACASFDEFRDFEERGEFFRSLVKTHHHEGTKKES
jgi:UDP-N-acetylmuramoylalanine--D-glutamate ligase